MPLQQVPFPEKSKTFSVKNDYQNDPRTHGLFTGSNKLSITRFLIGKEVDKSIFPQGTNEVHDIRLFYASNDPPIYQGQVIRYVRSLYDINPEDTFDGFNENGELLVKTYNGISMNFAPTWQTIRSDLYYPGEELNLEGLLKVINTDRDTNILRRDILTTTIH